MKAAPLVLSLALSASVLGLAPTASPPARAGWFSGRDDCAPDTRHARCEWDAELRNARRFESFSCCELAAYAESYRAAINQRIQSTYHRPVASIPAPTTPEKP